MINVSQSFHRTSANAVDDTLTLTKAEMLAVNDNLMPSKYLTVCQDDGYIYLYDKSATPNGTTGKFTKFEGGSGVTNYNDLNNRPLIEGVTLTGNKTASDLGLAKTSDLPSVYEGDTAGLVPAAGSDNEGKYLDNDGNWTVVPMPMIGTINRSDIYDTTEKVIGKWYDGRPVYQKTIKATQLSKTGSNAIWQSITAHGISNLKEMVDINVVGVNGIRATYISISLSTGDMDKYLVAYRDSDNVIVKSTSDRSSVDFYITLKYTKTTDAANSYNYADENDYSTSEKIIGKWIDGKTLYQRTFTATLPTVTTNGVWSESNVDVGLGNVDVIDIRGFVKNSLGGRKVFPCYRYLTSLSCDAGIDVMVTADRYLGLANCIINFSGQTAYITIKYTKS